jgi:hypothetical protein
MGNGCRLSYSTYEIADAIRGSGMKLSPNGTLNEKNEIKIGNDSVPSPIDYNSSGTKFTNGH